MGWSKVKELQSSAKVAVIPKNVTLPKCSDAFSILQGTLSMQDSILPYRETPASTGRASYVKLTVFHEFSHCVIAAVELVGLAINTDMASPSQTQ